MVEVVLLVIMGLLAAGVIHLWLRLRVQELAKARLVEVDLPEMPDGLPRLPDQPFVVNHWVVPWVLALLVGMVLYFVAGWPWMFALAFALITGLLVGQAETYRVARLTQKMEEQLADSIDLMVAALRAGAGVLAALENAAQEAKKPLKPQLDEMLGRIRFGDDPQVVLRALVGRVPLEPFRLLASALSVHWETGGSLAPTLATVGRVIRDRIEVSRRVRSLTAQGRTSVIAVLVLTYFLGIIIWRNDPSRMRQFLATSMGQYMVAGAIVFQGIGIVWTAVITRLKY